MSLDDFCAGCDQPLGPNRHEEWLHTPLGDTYHRTHPECTTIARERVQGKSFVPGPTLEERTKGKLGVGQQGKLDLEGED